MVLVCGSSNPSDEDWTTWTRAYSRAAAEHGVRSLFVVSRGGGPTARQRKEVITMLMEAHMNPVLEEFRTAVCSSSPMARAITSAIGWLAGAPGMRSFGNEQRDEALEYLGVPPEERSEILQVVRRFEQELRER